MLTERVSIFMARELPRIEAALHEWLPTSSRPGAERLNEALRYAVFPGGKRLRPALALLGSRLVYADEERGLQAACAIEFLHSSSLILDDLPGMDDADLRRNRAVLHLVYGEGIAVLSSLALLNQAYALLVRAAQGRGDRPQAHNRVEALLAETTRAIGSDGMIGGQVIDLEQVAVGKGGEVSESRDLKTVALTRLMMTAGPLACGADRSAVETLGCFGERLGKAYQICDDLLDELCESAATGKTARQDARHARLTPVFELGPGTAYLRAVRLIEEGMALLYERFGPRREVELLGDICAFVLSGGGRLGEAWRMERPKAFNFHEEFVS